MATYKYWAFISYSHQDIRWAKWLHKHLESYRLPARLVRHGQAKGSLPKRMAPVFRDQDELPTSSDLSAAITSALESSRHLIVICSPHSAQSRWVNEEILTFQRLGRADSIHLLIVQGEPHASENPETADQECFPNAATHTIDAAGQESSERIEPIAADARDGKDSKHDAMLRLVSGMLGIGFDELKRRELQRRQRRLLATTLVTLTTALIMAGLAIAAIIAKREADFQTENAIAAREETRLQLARNQWQHGIGQRDAFGNPLKASHYFTKAAAEFDGQSSNSRNAQLAADLLVRGLELREVFQLPSSVAGATLSADEKRILAWSVDGTVCVCDRATGKQLSKWQHDEAVVGAVFSQDAERVLSWSYDKMVRLRDVRADTEIHQLKHDDEVLGAAFSHDKQSILTWGAWSNSPGFICLWNTGTGDVLWIRQHGDSVIGGAFNGDDSQVLSWSLDGTARLTDVRTGDTLEQFKHEADDHQGEEFPQQVGGARFSEDESRILTWTDVGVYLWHIEAKQQVSLPIEGPVGGAVFSQDERRILGWSQTGARVWDAETGAPLSELNHDGFLIGARFSRGERQVLTWGAYGFDTLDTASGVCRVWSLDTEQLPREIRHDGVVHSAGFRQNDSVTWNQYGETGRVAVKVWNPRSGVRSVQFQHGARVFGMVLNQDGNGLMSWSEDGSVRLWELTLEDTLTAYDNPSLAHATEVAGEANRVLTWTDKTAQVWDADSRTLLASLQLPGFISGASLSPDGRRVLSWTGDAIHLLDSDTGELLVEHQQEAVQGAMLSHDKRLILSWGFDGSIVLWDTHSPEPICRLTHNQIWGAILSAEQDAILSWSFDGTIALWDIKKSARIWQVKHDDNVLAATFHRDESEIVSWSPSQVRIWDRAGNLLVEFQHKEIDDWESPGVAGVAFSKDQSRLLSWTGMNAAVSRDPVAFMIDPMGALSKISFSSGDLRLWDTKSGDLLVELQPGAAVEGAVFNRHENQVLSWGGSIGGPGFIQLWSLNEKRMIFRGDHSGVAGAAFDQSEQRILSWGENGVRLWDTDTGDMLAVSERDPEILGARFDREETSVFSWGTSGAGFWDVTTDYDWPRERLEVRLQARTGTRLDDAGQIRVLSREVWLEQKRQHEEVQRELGRK